MACRLVLLETKESITIPYMKYHFQKRVLGDFLLGKMDLVEEWFPESEITSIIKSATL